MSGRGRRLPLGSKMNEPVQIDGRAAGMGLSVVVLVPPELRGSKKFQSGRSVVEKVVEGDGKDVW